MRDSDAERRLTRRRRHELLVDLALEEVRDPVACRLRRARPSPRGRRSRTRPRSPAARCRTPIAPRPTTPMRLISRPPRRAILAAPAQRGCASDLSRGSRDGERRRRRGNPPVARTPGRRDEHDRNEHQREHVLMVHTRCRSAPVQALWSRSAELIESRVAQRRSRTPAIAWPWPMHIVAIAVARVATLELVQQRRGDPRAGRSERMAERDPAAVRIDVARLPPLVQARVGEELEDDRRERLVDLDDRDVVPCEPGLLERPLRTPRDCRAASGTGRRPTRPNETKRARGSRPCRSTRRLAREQHRRRPVDDRARVPGGHDTVGLEGGLERRELARETYRAAASRRPRRGRRRRRRRPRPGRSRSRTSRRRSRPRRAGATPASTRRAPPA